MNLKATLNIERPTQHQLKRVRNQQELNPCQLVGYYAIELKQFNKCKSHTSNDKNANCNKNADSVAAMKTAQSVPVRSV